MNRYTIRNGSDSEATVIGHVLATDAAEAIDTLNAYRNGFRTPDPGRGVPSAHVEWAHPEIARIPAAQVAHWRATEDPA